MPTIRHYYDRHIGPLTKTLNNNNYNYHKTKITDYITDLICAKYVVMLPPTTVGGKHYVIGLSVRQSVVR